MRCLYCLKKSKVEIYELTDKEKAYTKKMCGLTYPNIPLDNAFFEKMNNAQIEYLLSIVDMQDTQHSYYYATYVKKLQNLAELKKIGSSF